MLDLQNEQALTLNEARRLSYVKGRSGNNVSLCTIHRWSTRGVRGVLLETAKCGGTVITTAEAVLRFVAHLSGRPDAVSTRPTTQRHCSIAKANKSLDDEGIT